MPTMPAAPSDIPIRVRGLPDDARLGGAGAGGRRAHVEGQLALAATLHRDRLALLLAVGEPRDLVGARVDALLLAELGGLAVELDVGLRGVGAVGQLEDEAWDVVLDRGDQLLDLVGALV